MPIFDESASNRAEAELLRDILGRQSLAIRPCDRHPLLIIGVNGGLK
jgi:hypothetical protein